MNSEIPLWAVLLIAALGIIGTLVASLVSGAAATRREQSRTREELEREAERARAAAELEDLRIREAAAFEADRRREEVEEAERLRVLGERHGAYSEFLITASRSSRYLQAKRDQRAARSGAVVPLEIGSIADAVDRAYAAVQMVGDAATVETAGKVHHNLLVTAAHLEATHFSPAWVEEGCGLVNENLTQFVALARADVGIASDDSKPPVVRETERIDVRGAPAAAGVTDGAAAPS